MHATGPLQLGIMLPIGESVPDLVAPRWTEIRAIAKLAEDVGFDTLLLADHTLFRNAGAVVLPEGVTRGIWESWTMLSALAEATSRVELCPLVMCTAFRNPALLAKMADTLDEVSGGRLVLGLGAGWHEPGLRAFGFPTDHLAGRFEEALQIIHSLLRTGRCTLEGKYYTVLDCELRPRGPRPQGAPILIGAKRPRMMRLIAKYADAYNTVWHVQADAVDTDLANLDAACREVGRDPKTMIRTAGVEVAMAGPGGDLTGLPERAIKGTPEAIAEQLRAFERKGITHLTCRVAPSTTTGVERFARVIEALRK